MVILAFAYLAVYAAIVLIPDMPEPFLTILDLAGLAIWLVFVVDLAIRVWLAPRRWSFLAHHPIDVAATIIPAIRMFRVLRVLSAGQWLMARGQRLAFGKTAVSIVVGVTFVAFVGALAVLDEERGRPGANINDFGDALWWAFTTMSTVGYGDNYPVTLQGRSIAVVLMLLGISLLGIVSGTLATAFLSRVQDSSKSGDKQVLAKLDLLEGQVAALTAALHEALGGPPVRGDDTALPPAG